MPHSRGAPAPTSSPQEPKQRAPLIEGGFIVLVALLCLGFQLRLPTLLPSEADYAEVQKVLEAEAQPGDALLLFPWWAERARLFAPERVRVVGYQGSDGDSLELHPRVWVLAQPKLPKSDWGAFWSVFSPGRTAIGSTRSFGPLELSLYQNGRAKPVRFSFVDQLGQASVYLEGGDGSRQQCNWDGRAHRCPNGGYVAAEWHEVRFQPRRCLRLFPPGGPTKLVVELNGVPAADQLALQGGFGWDKGYYRDEQLTPVLLAADVNGTRAVSLDFPKGKYGLFRAEAPGVPAGASVRIWSQSQNPEHREMCVEAWGFGS